MPTLTRQEIENVVPGESMTKPKGALPFEQPALTANPEAAIQMIFEGVTEPKSARKLLDTIESGVPTDVIVDSMAMMLNGEGVVSPQAIGSIIPAMLALVENLADAAGVPHRRSEQPDPWTEPEEGNVMPSIIDETVASFVEEPEGVESEGLMERPEEGQV